MSTLESNGSILVVDDEEAVADVYSLQLRTRFDDVHTAYGGEDALEVIEEQDGSIDVALLDRRMPDLWGDEVLDRIRERGYECRVIMVTAVDPDFDVLEMPFDDYLHKPIEKADLIAAVEQQLHATEYDESISEYFELSSKIALLEAEKSSTELEEHDEYQKLTERAAALGEQADESIDSFGDVTQAFADINRT